MRPCFQHQAGELLAAPRLHNFCRVHRAIRVTPARQAGIADSVWDIAELLSLKN